MDGWSEVARIPLINNNKLNTNSNGIIDEYQSINITSLKFDTTQNLIWCGDSQGYTRSVTIGQQNSPFHFQLFPYTKFQTNIQNQKILQILSQKDGILSLSEDQLTFNNRRGLTKQAFNAESFTEGGDNFKNLNAMTFNCNSTNDIVLGNDSSLLKIDLNKPTTLDKLDHQGKITLLNSTPRFLTLANGNGSLELFDPNSNSSLKTFSAHNGLITGLDVRGNYIATCGYSIRPKRYHYNQTPEYLVDPLVNIFDIRTMRAMAPVPFAAGASSIRFHPKLTNIIIAASQHGQIHFIDIFDQTNVHLYQADLSLNQPQLSSSMKTAKLNDLNISENGDFFMFNDGYSNLHLWSITNSGSLNKNFVSFPTNIEKPDIINGTVASGENAYIDIDDNITPLSSVGMPYYKELLLSNWPTDLKFIKETAKLPNKIDDELLLKSEQNPGKFLKYDELKYGPGNLETPYYSIAHTKDTQIPQFLSERSDDNNHRKKSLSDDIFETSKDSKIPNFYSRLQIQYSKFGVKDFDFAYYNKTENYCGLENHSDNSYINSLLQLYRFQSIFYNKVVQSLNKEWLPNDLNTIENNPEGSSILNELAYLFDMMYKAKSKNVKTSNFSQVLNHDKNARHLLNFNELMNLNSQEVRELIISFNHYLLLKLDQDFKKQFDTTFTITEFFYQIETKGNLPSCDFHTKHGGTMFSLELITPPNNMLNKMSILMNPNHQQQPTNIANIKKNLNILTYLDYSSNQFRTVPCHKHKDNYPHTLEFKTSITKLPPVLVINVNLTNEEFKIINNLKQWLVPEFYAIKTINNGYTYKLNPPPSTNNSNYKKYELLGYVCEISHQTDTSRIESNNLVSFIKINNSWYFFNDYLVIPIDTKEVFNLTYSWKKPVIIIYQEQTSIQKFEYFNFNTQKFKGNSSILYRDHFIGTIKENYKKEYKLLTRQEAPEPGTLVAIDAEFVTLKPEQIEISYTGYKKLIKPKELSLARVSVLRGDLNLPSTLFGEAFIDDYIAHTSPIYDYLTNFSGIESNDLNLNKSTKNLVTLQTAYRKLWLLLNLGVIFVGHGLYNDFRIINLQVPTNQIKDTSEFYYKSNFKRQLSLKFLSYIVLGYKVQLKNHDSIEDAKTALLLYKKYIELNNQGNFENMINHIYFEGNKLRYKVPT
ncbi:PAN2 [Candida pseudojiufengensis]|uniref:PAN2 n=1 Tax=Candida pseudojiufengensis TaxID=497109 RepID=UPI0022249C30|nr:PAN2 [Candida pseudojiufengensis]KAI5961385.1 PAN2 [Candida pseudojiufengensis]